MKKEYLQVLMDEYTIVLASNDAMIEEVKTIREDVYSKKYNKSKAFLNSIGLIENEEDKQSFIFLLQEIKTGNYIGTIRIFFINQKSKIKKLPMELTVERNHIEDYLKKFPVVEISRLALLGDLPRHDTLSALELRTLLTYLLMAAARVNIVLYNTNMVFAIMEKSLFKIIGRQKVFFNQISDYIDSFGRKGAPFAIPRDRYLIDTEEKGKAITLFYLKKLCKNPDKLWEFVDNNPYLERSDMQLDRICKLFEEYGDDIDVNLLIGEDLVK